MYETSDNGDHIYDGDYDDGVATMRLMSTIPVSGVVAAVVYRHPAAPLVAAGVLMLLLCVHCQPHREHVQTDSMQVVPLLHIVVVLMSRIPTSAAAAMAVLVAAGVSMFPPCMRFELRSHQHYCFLHAHRYMQDPELVRVLTHSAPMGPNAAMCLEPAT